MTPLDQPAAAAPESARPRGRWRRAFWRWMRRALLLAAALVAALFVTFFSVDLGPAARAHAERYASRYLERPMHIGALKALAWPGRFELTDVVIEGLSPEDEPFFDAGRIVVDVNWRTLLRWWSRELYVDVRMTDWTMAIETWPGRHSLPKLTPRSQPSGEKRFTTTVRVLANGGQFTYRDHVAPWSVVAPNLEFALVRAESLGAYVGTARFEKGVVQIQEFLPMSADMTTRFTLDGPHVVLHHIDLVTDGARSSLNGEVYLGSGGNGRPGWPEQTYHVDSRLDFSRMRELFFANESWRVAGEGRFQGTFHVPQHGKRELKGDFTSALATLDTPDTRLVFPRLHGSLVWLPERFEVTRAGADFYGGRANFSYSLAPLGQPDPSEAAFQAEYQSVDLSTFSRGVEWQEMDLRGQVSGRNELRWRNGRLRATMTGGGRLTITPPPDVMLADPALDPIEPLALAEQTPFDPDEPLGPLPIGGEIAYQLDPGGIAFDPSWIASPSTFVGFSGRADYGDQSNLPFHVTSLDWQQSDRILAAILTAAGAPTRAIPVAGFGQFDGAMTGAFTRPRIRGTFAGEAVRSWGVTWGRALGEILIDRQFVTISNGVIGDTPDARIVADGRFSLGFRGPAESADELEGVHVRVTNWPLEDFRRAFNLTDWPVEGVVGAAEFQLSGPYRGPFGSGTLRLDQGTAWGEAFDTAASSLRFNGSGLEVSQIIMTKGPGEVTGSALIEWDGTYAFDAAGERIPVESLTSFTLPEAPLSGVLQFTASGEGAFSSPSYAFKASIPDLSAGSQGIGAVSGVLEVRNNTLYIQQVEAHSVLVQVSGTGSIALNDAYDATLNFRFTNSRIDPYLPLVAPTLAERLSQYTRAVVGGTVQVQGELKNTAALAVHATVEDVELTLFDYLLTNDGPVQLRFENDVSTISRLVLVGTDTSLTIEGRIPHTDQPMAVTANGRANLAILQLVFPNLSSSGAATLDAAFSGSIDAVTASGQASIADGRLRYRGFPHALEQINGPIVFDADRITVDEVRARMGEGEVTFSGAIELEGLLPDRFDLQAEGRSMSLRFPAGFRSTVNISLALTGPVGAPIVTGDVTVLRSIYLAEIENEQALLALASLGSPAVSEVAGDQAAVPLRLDLRIRAAAGRLMVDTTNAQIFASANLLVRGTLEAPSMTGLVTIERGHLFLNGNRFMLQPSSVDFFNPSAIQPSFDVAFTTRVRVPGQTYDVTIRITGEADRLNLDVSSEPYLPLYDVVNLLLGERYDSGALRSAELRAVQAPQFAQQQAMRTLAAQLLTMPISSRIGSVVQRTIPFDTFSIVPLLGNETALEALSPTARVTLGKRISDRVFLTYSRALNATRQYDIILLEYEQSDRVSWVLSRNEDRTFALDFRIRHVF